MLSGQRMLVLSEKAITDDASNRSHTDLATIAKLGDPTVRNHQVTSHCALRHSDTGRLCII